MTEEWRDVREFPDLYQVSSEGRVRSKDRPIPNVLTGGVSVYRGRLLKGRVRKDGYYEYLLSIKGKNIYRNAHRLVALAFLGLPPPGKPLVLHNDGVKTNNSLSNLRWGSNSDNMHDRAKHGTDPMLNKTHCPQGHPYSGENLTYDSGTRRCRTCRNKRNRDSGRVLRGKGLAVSDSRHGTRAGYNTHGCRCTYCKNAQAEYRRGNIPDD